MAFAPPRFAHNCPRSSADESGCLLSGGTGVRVTPRAPIRFRMVGRVARQRDANAPRPFRLRRFDPCTIRHAGIAQWQSRCLPSRRCEFDSRCPLQHCHVRLAAEDTGPSNRMARVRIPHVAPLVLPLRLAGRAPGFELGRLGSNPRGAANSSVGRAGFSYAPSAAGSIPASATRFLPA